MHCGSVSQAFTERWFINGRGNPPVVALNPPVVALLGFWGGHGGTAPTKNRHFSDY